VTVTQIGKVLMMYGTDPGLPGRRLEWLWRSHKSHRLINQIWIVFFYLPSNGLIQWYISHRGKNNSAIHYQTQEVYIYPQ